MDICICIINIILYNILTYLAIPCHGAEKEYKNYKILFWERKKILFWERKKGEKEEKKGWGQNRAMNKV